MHPFYPQDSSRDASDIFSAAPQTSQSQQPMNFQHQQQQQLGNLQQQVNMDMLESLLAMQDTSSQSNQQHQHSPSSATPQALLEHQLRLNQLQQLQQLQNQIFQQQLELLSGQSSFSNMPPVVDRPRETPQYGLPTPASSTELRAQSTTDFVSPMLLHSSGNNILVQNPMLPNFIPQIPQHLLPSAPHSAPANIVFQSPAGYPLSDPGDLELSELPPISSPLLDSYGSNAFPPSGSSSQPPGHLRNATSGPKRPNEQSSGDESSVTSRPARKRPSPPDRNTAAASAGTRRSSTRTVRSATSTPLFPASAPSLRPSPAQRSVHDMNDIPGDTPSPVDPPMPPPAHAQPEALPSATSGPSMSPTPPLPATPASPVTGQHATHLTPVTPASMLKLGRLAVGSSQSSGKDSASVSKPEGKPATRSSAAATSSKTKAADKSVGTQHISPALKPIRPAGNAVVTPATPSTPFMPPQIRKSSHKAAEQKRRDSLKTSFDDLRILLPPIPLPSEDGYPDEPILPGAMPPRGPPKGNAEGPNRGVSKLQLLRCGNEFIKALKGRVDRRDEEIVRLREEVRRLRELLGEDAATPTDGQDMIDLERDLDACEITGGGFGRAITGAMRGSSVGEGDMDEDCDS